jgi:hypothetical protein
MFNTELRFCRALAGILTREIARLDRTLATLKTKGDTA